MWSRGHLLYVNVSVPEVKWIKGILPVFIVTEIIHSLVDLLTLGAYIAPNVKLTKNKISISTILNTFKVLEQLFECLHLVEDELVKVHVGSDDVDIIIKVL